MKVYVYKIDGTFYISEEEPKLLHVDECKCMDLPKYEVKLLIEWQDNRIRLQRELQQWYTEADTLGL